MTPKVEVPLALVAFYLAMSVDEQKIVGRFYRLIPPRFLGSSIEDAFDLFIICVDKICNLSLVGNHGVY